MVGCCVYVGLAPGLPSVHRTTPSEIVMAPTAVQIVVTVPVPEVLLTTYVIAVPLEMVTSAHDKFIFPFTFAFEITGARVGLNVAPAKECVALVSVDEDSEEVPGTVGGILPNVTAMRTATTNGAHCARQAFTTK